MQRLAPLLIISIFAIFATSVLPGAARAGLSKKRFGKRPLPMLEGRLTLRMPAGAKLQGRSYSIMSEPHSTQEETRAVVEQGGEKLVVMVYELFALGGGQLEKRVRDTVARMRRPPKTTFAVAPLKTASTELKAFTAAPSRLNTSAAAVLLLGVYVMSPDGTLQLVNIYVNPKAARDARGCRRMARRIAASIALGKKSLQRAAGERRMPAYGDPRSLVARVPADYVMTRQGRHHFHVYRLRRLVPLGERGPIIRIYFGAHPSQDPKRRPQVRKTKGKVLGRSVTWYRRKETSGVMLADTYLPYASKKPLIPAGKGAAIRVEDGRGLQLNITLIAFDSAQLKSLEGIARSLRWAKKTGYSRPGP